MEDFQEKRSQTQFGCIVILVIILAVLAYVALTVVSHYRESDKATYTPSMTFETTLVRLGSNRYEIPGGIAFIDGRDPGARPPTTLMRIPLWDNPSEIMEVTIMHHGDRVELLAYQETSGGERYAKVRYKGYSGWVSERYLDTQSSKSIGKEIDE